MRVAKYKKGSQASKLARIEWKGISLGIGRCLYDVTGCSQVPYTDYLKVDWSCPREGRLTLLVCNVCSYRTNMQS